MINVSYEMDSSLIEDVGYDVENKTLEISFQSGDTYQYFDVPKGLVTEFMFSESAGVFFNEQIKDNFDYQKV
jgi:hypothetical protein